ncbi:low affinity immunoglobulin gamma Fc region receptor III-like isoform X2 [Xyrichtys novacula]|nr:low affinity immunoglobulin gamma Fc region receptor III-like isoform X2 [Xyrichtys novacula]
MGVSDLYPRLWVPILFLLSSQSHINADAAFLRINPNRLQFFEYESLRLDCEGLTGATEWRLMGGASSTAARWEDAQRWLTIEPAFEAHSGEYWCENGRGERSNAINISVSAGDVILESPALPVTEGQTVTLGCRKRQTPQKLAADFYKDGGFMETGYKGKVTLQGVSKSDEGLYQCRISGPGESPESRLIIRDGKQTPPPPTPPPTPPPSSPPGSSQLIIPLSVFFTVFFVAVLLSVMALLRYRKPRETRFLSDVPTRRSESVFENSDQFTSVYVNVPRKKNKKGTREQKQW